MHQFSERASSAARAKFDFKLVKQMTYKFMSRRGRRGPLRRPGTGDALIPDACYLEVGLLWMHHADVSWERDYEVSASYLAIEDSVQTFQITRDDFGLTDVETPFK